MTLLALVLIAGATARVTRLVTTDRVTRAPREALLRALLGRNEKSLVAYLVVCDWCVSVYTGAAVAGAWWAWGENLWYQAVCVALTASYVTGILASATETGD